MCTSPPNEQQLSSSQQASALSPVTSLCVTSLYCVMHELSGRHRRCCCNSACRSIGRVGSAAGVSVCPALLRRWARGRAASCIATYDIGNCSCSRMPTQVERTMGSSPCSQWALIQSERPPVLQLFSQTRWLIRDTPAQINDAMRSELVLDEAGRSRESEYPRAEISSDRKDLTRAPDG